MPLIGATVIFTGTSLGTITDIDGRFTLFIGGMSENIEGQTITVSYIGYKTQNVIVFHNHHFITNVRVQMEEDKGSLDEVAATSNGHENKTE